MDRAATTGMQYLISKYNDWSNQLDWLVQRAAEPDLTTEELTHRIVDLQKHNDMAIVKYFEVIKFMRALVARDLGRR